MKQAFVVAQPRHAALRALNYQPAVERLRQLRKGRSFVRLRDLLADLAPGYATVFARRDCDPDQGVELLSQADMFACEPQGRTIRRDSMAHPEWHEVRKWDVLIAGAGTLAPTELYGRAVIADGRVVGKYVGQDSVRLRFKEPGDDLALFAYAYLASPSGLQALRSASYGTKILRVRRDMLADLPVPQPDQETVARVAGLIRACVEQRDVYLRELRSARDLLRELPEMQEAHALCAERRRQAVRWRGALPTISAWTFASTGGALDVLRQRWSGRLGDVLTQDGVFNGPRFARVPCSPPNGIDFMSQRDAFLIRPIPRRIVHPGFSDRLLFAPAGTILVGGHGTLGEGEIFGRAVLVHGRFAKSAFTQDLLRLVPREGFSTLIYAYVTTTTGMRLLRSTAVGTKILSMRLDLVRALPFPDVDAARAQRVSRHVEASIDARDGSDRAEAEAVRIIEGEVLSRWLA